MNGGLFIEGEGVLMIRMMFLILVMSMLLVGAAKAGTSLPALLLMGSLVVLAVLILLTRSQPEE